MATIPFEIPDFDSADWKTPRGGMPTGPGVAGPGGGAGAALGAGGFYGAGPQYDPGMAPFGYTRRMRPVSSALNPRSAATPQNALAARMGGGFAPGVGLGSVFGGGQMGSLATALGGQMGGMQGGRMASPTGVGAVSQEGAGGQAAAGAGGRTASVMGGGEWWNPGGRVGQAMDASRQQKKTGGFVSSGNPWADLAQGGQGINALIPWLLQGAAGADLFNPLGSQGISDAIAQRFAREAGGRQAGLRNSLQAGAVDNPNAYAMASLMGDLGLQRDLSGAQSDAQLQQMMGSQDWYRNMLDQLVNFQRQWDAGQQGFNFNSALQSQQRGNPWSQVGGQLLGAGLGAFAKGGF